MVTLPKITLPSEVKEGISVPKGQKKSLEQRPVPDWYLSPPIQ